MVMDRKFTLGTLTDLIRIDSRNPALEAGAPGEWDLAVHVNKVLEALGWTTTLRDLGSRRANVVATRLGSGHAPSLMINVHLDTVGVSGMPNPFSAELREGRIRGRGAQDTKGGMAAVLGMAKALAEEGTQLSGDLVLAFVADEEHESLGTSDLVQRVKTDAAIVIEPSDLNVCVAHRGFGVFEVRTHGRTAHGGRSDLGIDANLHMGHVLTEIQRLKDRWSARHTHPRLGSATLHVPLIAGGRHLYMYAHECTASLECRTVPGQSAGTVLGEVQALLEALDERIVDFRGSVRPGLWRPPYEIDAGRPIVRALLAASAKVRGTPANTIVHPWWEDSGLLGEAGIEAVVIGPRGGGLHTDDEWVDADSVIELGEVLYGSVLSYCGAVE